MDEYIKTYKEADRSVCCRYQLNRNRKDSGYEIFQNLLKERGKHYKAKYTLLIPPEQYNGKLKKYPIKCEAHNQTVFYSMKDLNFITSCPCPSCRVDPNHKNECVDLIKRRNAGRPGQVIRHASKVKEKYNSKCALSNSTFDLQHHHLDGQDFYTQTQLLWQHNGICLNGTIHRDFHYNFLLNHSVIAKEYTQDTFDSTNENFDVSSTPNPSGGSNPDFNLAGAEVSRYTFLEYLRFLIYDIKKNNSLYVNALNQQMAFNSQGGKITLNKLEIAMQEFCDEYKGENWALVKREDIPYANNLSLWEKVDSSWALDPLT